MTIHGERHYLWRAVDQDDNVLATRVQSRRNKQAVKKFFRKLLKGLQYMPRVIITDKLKSYGAAKREILPGVEHRQSRYLNNRCENSHRPTRQREYRMQGFKSAGHAQGFASLTVPAVHQHQYLSAAIENLWNAYQAHTNSFSVWTWLLTGAGVYQLLQGNILPPALTLLLYATSASPLVQGQSQEPVE